MPTQQTVLKIFLSSPSDVTSEREVVFNIVSELNQLWKRSYIQLDLLRWEDMNPGFGAYPQDVLNRQIGEDYDIFLGILWSRFGTPMTFPHL